MNTIVEDQLQRIMFALAPEATPEMRRKAKQDCLHVAKAYNDIEQKLYGTEPLPDFKSANIIDTVEA